MLWTRRKYPKLESYTKVKEIKDKLKAELPPDDDAARPSYHATTN